MKLVIMEKKSYINSMTVSIQTLQRSSSLLRNNKEKRKGDKMKAGKIKVENISSICL